MKLNELNKYFDNVKIYKNGEFDYLGLMGSKIDKKILTFIEKVEYVNSLSENISAVICNDEIADKIPSNYGVIVCKNPRMQFFQIHNFFCENLKEYLREDFDTKIGENCSISNLSVISNKGVIIGNNVIIEEFVVIRENTIIGDNSIIRSGAKIGGIGFEFKNNKEIVMPVTHCGGVILGKNVEIQYNTCIDKAIYPWDNTFIDDYTKVDNLIHIAHGVKIGKRCLLPAGVAISGRTEIGNDCWIGVNATVSNGLKIGDNCRVSIGSVVTKSLEDGKTVTGNFAIDHDKFIKIMKSIR